MAEDQDESQKTEEPTAKRLQDAREKGQLANSREVSTFSLLAVATLLAATMVPLLPSMIATSMRGLLENAHQLPVGDVGLRIVMIELIGQISWPVLIPLLAMVVAAIAASGLQNSIVWTATPLQPKLERISPISGFKRLFSLKSLVEFGKNIAKISFVGALGLAVLYPQSDRILGAAHLPTIATTNYMSQLTLWLLASVTAVTALLAGVDYAYQRFDYLKRMRMSRRDITDEQKQTDGDPIVKMRLRAIRMERAKRRMMAEVPNSTVVITNPTHFAVALRYEMDEMGAPELVAKGVDRVALRIREIANENDIAIVENPPLARALHKSVDLGDTIPPAHYQAVAEIISQVMKLRDKL